MTPTPTTGDYRTIYYESTSEIYWQVTEGNPDEGTVDSWEHVSKARIDQVLDDKAYIDMPNQDSFNFLDPRQIYFGIRVSFDLN